MSSSSDEGNEEGSWIFYRHRPEWKDVKPLLQDDGPHSVVTINYTDKFRDVYDYFRAVLKTGEKSERALELTADALALNPANYTVWQYRREILKTLKVDLGKELAFSKQVIEDNRKNYQVWHHRQVIVEMLDDPSQELLLTSRILEQDNKNYHAWQHRQWTLMKFGLFDQELAFVDSLLENDIRNNSAWNQRYFVVSRTTGFTPEVLDHEIEYVLSAIRKVANNESAWNYLRGCTFFLESGISKYDKVVQICDDLYDRGVRSPYLASCMMDILEERLENTDLVKRTAFLRRTEELCNEMSDQHDIIRADYWKYVCQRLNQRFSGGSGDATDNH